MCFSSPSWFFIFLYLYYFQHLNDRILNYWQFADIFFSHNYHTLLGPHQHVMFVDDYTLQHTYSKTLLCRQRDCFLDKHSYYIRHRLGKSLLGDSTASWKGNQIVLYRNNIYMNKSCLFNVMQKPQSIPKLPNREREREREIWKKTLSIFEYLWTCSLSKQKFR